MAEGLCLMSRLLFQPPGRLALLSVHKGIQVGSTELSPSRTHTQLCHVMAANLGFSTQTAFPCLPVPWALFGRKSSKTPKPQRPQKSISSLINEGREAQTTGEFAAQYPRAGESEPWHARDSEATSSQTKHSSWVIQN